MLKSTYSPLPALPRAWLCQILSSRMGQALLHFPLASEAQNGTCTERENEPGSEPCTMPALCPALGTSVPMSF